MAAVPSDLERFVELYRSVGIEFQPTTEWGFKSGAWKVSAADGDSMLYLCVGDIIKGYIGFYTLIRFDPAGKFVGQWIYE